MAISDNYVPLRTLGNGVTTEFSGNWKILAEGYERVYLEDVDTGVQELQEIGTDYELEFDDDGFTVTFNSAPSSDYYVVVGREIALDQTDPYKTSQGFQGAVVENSFDKLTAITQDLQNQVDRAPKLPLGNTTNPAMEAPATGKALLWDADGNLVNSDDDFNDIVTDATAQATAAAASAAAAAASATAASTAETAAELAETNAETAEVNAEAAAALAQEWAVNPEDDPVTGYPGEYSAYHWAQKALEYAGGGQVKITSDDTTPAFLLDKLTAAATSGIALTETGGGGNETLAVTMNITGITAMAATIATNDEFAMYDVSAAALVKATPAQLFKAISTLTAESSVDKADIVLFSDTSGSANARRCTVQELFAAVNTLDADASPDTAADYLLLYDTSGGTSKKVLVDEILSGLVEKTYETTTNSTSGTAIDFGSIPSTTDIIHILLNDVSLSSTADIYVQLADAGGVEATGYSSQEFNVTGGGLNVLGTVTAAFRITAANAAVAFHGRVILERIPGTNTWLCDARASQSATPRYVSATGIKTLSDVLTSVRLASSNAADTFDAGSITLICWEYKE